MRTVVISQPMFFPWAGLFEQIRLADAYVHYDDVQFSRGSFANRVQLKAPDGIHWLTVPLRDAKLGVTIRDAVLDDGQDWRARHLALLEGFYCKAPYRDEMLALVNDVYGRGHERLGELAIATLTTLCTYLDLADRTSFHPIEALTVPGHGTQRVLDVVRKLGGTRYVTGHGARNYLDHVAFENAGILVEYMDYQRRPYPQLHGAFTPYVSILDLVANCGRAGREVLASSTRPWREFLHVGTT